MKAPFFRYGGSRNEEKWQGNVSGKLNALKEGTKPFRKGETGKLISLCAKMNSRGFRNLVFLTPGHGEQESGKIRKSIKKAPRFSTECFKATPGLEPG